MRRPWRCGQDAGYAPTNRLYNQLEKDYAWYGDLGERITEGYKAITVIKQAINEINVKADGVAKPGKKVQMDLPAKHGGDREGLTGFLTAMRVYLKLYEDEVADDEVKSTFAASRLDGKALRWFEQAWKEYLTIEDKD
ncbi:hypothetical protein B0I37DRAFT_417905 [Chaetomium sp. MPI-CAGE-AT-0009]|nr:hypothetical protein B0I37DRAFT_417905 [Chaetomium sp. MPI-CAGE-AT-0009]